MSANLIFKVTDVTDAGDKRTVTMVPVPYAEETSQERSHQSVFYHREITRTGQGHSEYDGSGVFGPDPDLVSDAFETYPDAGDTLVVSFDRRATHNDLYGAQAGDRVMVEFRPVVSPANV